MKKHGVWTMIALMGTIAALAGLIMCVVTGHRMLRDRKGERE